MRACQTGQHRTIQEFTKEIHVYDKGMPLKMRQRNGLGGGCGVSRRQVDVPAGGGSELM